MKNIILLIMLLCQTSCAVNYKYKDCTYNYSVRIGDHIAIGEAELLEAVSSALKYNKASEHKIEIIIFGYSSGKEVFSYSQGSSVENPQDGIDDIEIGIHPGRLEALVKIKIKDELKDAVFIKTTGKTREELIQKLIIEIRNLLCNSYP